MARHKQPISRDDLVIRYARILATTFGDAWDKTLHIDSEVLRDAVEQAEALMQDSGVNPDEFTSWQMGQRTTTVTGQTR